MDAVLLQRITAVFQRFLPLWILFSAIIAFLLPAFFMPLGGATPFALAFIFLLMGMTITIDRFVIVLKKPKELMVGMGLKWILTVGISVILAYVFFRDNANLAAGIILAGTVPSGTSANLYTLLAEGTVALSITLAAVDTFIAPFMTPVLMQLFAGQFIPVSFLDLFLNIVYIVFVPLFIGLFIQWKWGKKVEKVQPFFPLSSMLALILIVLGVIAGAYESIVAYTSLLPMLCAVIFFQVTIPMAGGYYIAKFLKLPEASCRAMIFHVAISNTALSATLAMNHIAPLAAVPSVLNMVMNLSIGAFVANVLKNRPAEVTEKKLKAEA